MQYLFSDWPALEERISQAKHIILLSDFDGTLTPIVEKPDMAVLPEKTRYLLRALAAQPNITLGIISGRALDDIKNLINIPDISYVGNHGFEITGPCINYTNPEASELKPTFQKLHQTLISNLENIKGVLVENKGLTLSVHYRGVEESQEKEVQHIVENGTSILVSKGIARVTTGKKVYEIKPAVSWDKGKAIRLLIDKFSKAGSRELLPIFLGDDVTDEDGFQAIQQNSESITVIVGENRETSTAQYYLNSPDEVYLFLHKIHECPVKK